MDSVLLVVFGAAFRMRSRWSVHLAVAWRPASALRFLVRVASLFPGTHSNLRPLALPRERPVISFARASAPHPSTQWIVGGVATRSRIAHQPARLAPRLSLSLANGFRPHVAPGLIARAWHSRRRSCRCMGSDMALHPSNVHFFVPCEHHWQATIPRLLAAFSERNGP